MKVLVIGGSGFLGSHVADELSRQGHSVRIFDQHSSPWLRENQEMIIGDILKPDELDRAVSGCNVVYNFASLADLNKAIHQPIDTVRINIMGNVNILEACVRHKIDRFIYASTVYVYSRDGGFYRCSKQAAEQYVEEYQKTYGLNFTILRYGSLYGPRADDSNGLFRIVKHAIDTGEILYEGNADSMREYIHVQDAAMASIEAMTDKFLNDSFVLTGQEPMRILDLLHMLAEIFGAGTRVRIVDKKQPGHYTRTPYAYEPKIGRKYIPPLHVDLGQGLLQLIGEIKKREAIEK